MPLLDDLIIHAKKLGVHDIHFIASKSQNSLTILYRNQRKLIFQEIYPLEKWPELLEFLKFHCGYRLDRRNEFQDGSLTLQNTALRIAFTPFPMEYITVRLHYLNDIIHLTYDSHGESFLSQWRSEAKLLMIAGGLHSGKTTQYYDILHKESSLQHSVISLEDPIEKPFSSFFQLKYCNDLSIQTGASLVRFDVDLVGLGELRRDCDWKMLHFLSLSSIRTITTCHGASLESLASKIKVAHCIIPDLHNMLYGVIFLEAGLSPIYVPYAHLI